MRTTHHLLKGGAMKPGWAVLITVLVLGAVAGTICGIYYGTLNRASQYIPPPSKASPKASLPVNTKAFMNTCDGKVVNPAIPCMSFTQKPRTRAGVSSSSNCGNCTASEVCENGACAPLCQPKCTDNTCVGTGQGSGLPDGCGGTCCGCTDTQTCVNGQCVSPSKPCPSGCSPGQTCVNGVCTGGCGTACPQGETCVNGACQSNASQCSPACTSNQTCVQVNGKYECKCAPNCPANSCGSDGCGGTCSCPSGQTCNSTQTCVACAPVCSPNTCGNPDGCGGTCGCSVGQVCSNNTCVTDTSPWEGWATTTQFGCGDPTWGNVDPLEGIDHINSDANKRMGGAVPWIELCNKYGSKQNQVQTTVDSAAGTNPAKACYLVQPINKYPDQISGITDPLFPNAPQCDPTKGACTDINDPTLQATDSTGKPFDTFLIIPYEGCGGDCNVTDGSGADCINDCVASQNPTYSREDAINGGLCQWNKLQNPLCDAAKVLYNDGNWGWNDTIKQNFLKYSRPIAISPDTDYGRNITKAAGSGHANFCSGQNMHLDMANTTPYWTLNPNGMGDIAQTSANTNILLRYKRVPCNYYGNVDINAPYSPDVECPNGFTWTDLKTPCGTGETRLNPGDAAWPRSKEADHACCGSPVNPTPSKCGVGQVFQAKGGACPCPKDQCFYNASPTADGSGSCGQCSGSVSACDAGVKC